MWRRGGAKDRREGREESGEQAERSAAKEGVKEYTQFFASPTFLQSARLFLLDVMEKKKRKKKKIEKCHEITIVSIPWRLVMVAVWGVMGKWGSQWGRGVGEMEEILRP